MKKLPSGGDYGTLTLSSEFSERGVIGALLSDPGHLSEVATLPPETFTNTFRKLIFEKMLELYNRFFKYRAAKPGAPFDYDLLLSSFADSKYLEDVTAELLECRNVVIAMEVFSGHVDMLNRLAYRRAVVDTGKALEQMAIRDDISEDTIEQVSSQMIGALALQGKNKPILSPEERAKLAVEDILERQSPKDGQAKEINTGYSKLDLALGGGFARGLFSIVMGITGGYKTTWGLASARRMAALGQKVLYASPEMPEHLMSLKDYSAGLSLPLDVLRTPGAMNEDQIAALFGKASVLAKRNYYTWPYSGNVEEMMAAAVIMKQKVGLDLLFIDYLQIVTASKKDATAYDRVSYTSDKLRAFARDEHIAVVGLAQMSRMIYSTPNMLPMASYLKESGQLENDAAQVIGLYWPWGIQQITGKFIPAGYVPFTEPEWRLTNAKIAPVSEDENGLPRFTELQLHVLKNRTGAQGLVRLGLDAAYNEVFDPYADYVYQPEAVSDAWTGLPTVNNTTITAYDLTQEYLKLPVARHMVAEKAYAMMDFLDIRDRSKDDSEPSLIQMAMDGYADAHHVVDIDIDMHDMV